MTEMLDYMYILPMFEGETHGELWRELEEEMGRNEPERIV